MSSSNVTTVDVIESTSFASTPTVYTARYRRKNLYVIHRQKRISKNDGKNILRKITMLRAKSSLKKGVKAP